jgi:hypothetical protein
MKFKLGQIVMTQGVRANFSDWALSELIARHVQGDWGDLEEFDRLANEEALANGGRLFSAYNVADFKVWIITEEDRSVTTALLPDEY